MPGLLIIAHAPLASSFQRVARHAFPDAALEAFDVPADMPLEEIEASVRVLLAAVRNPDALILTDVVGATPCNVSIRLASQMSVSAGVQIKVISGVNVPMLWRALGHAGDTLDKLVECACSGATDGVKIVSGTRPQHQALRTAAHDQDAYQYQQ